VSLLEGNCERQANIHVILSVSVRGRECAHRWGMSFYRTYSNMALLLCIYMLGVLTWCGQYWLKHAQINEWICTLYALIVLLIHYCNTNNCFMKSWSSVKWLTSHTLLFCCCLKLFCAIQVITVLLYNCNCMNFITLLFG